MKQFALAIAAVGLTACAAEYTSILAAVGAIWAFLALIGTL